MLQILPYRKCMPLPTSLGGQKAIRMPLEWSYKCGSPITGRMAILMECAKTLQLVRVYIHRNPSGHASEHVTKL